MANTSGSKEKPPRAQSEMFDSLTEDCEGTECAMQGQRKQETFGLADRVQQMPSSSGSTGHTARNEEMVITSIRATDVALGLRRLPAGFYVVVHHSGLKWRTENKRSSVNNDVVEWNGPIPITSDLSTTVSLEVYASFEFEPMLGDGEQLRKLTVTVKRLLDRSVKDVPFTFFPKIGDVVSPCSSIFITIKHRNCESSNSSSPVVLRPHCSITESRGELEEATNHAHSALSHYQKYGRKRDLEHSVKGFERALSICPRDHPCHAAAQSNLAKARFILYRVGDTDASFEVPLSLCRSALAARPVGHSDHLSTLVLLAVGHFARFEKRRDEGERAQAEVFLREVMELSSTESHENQAAAIMLQLYSGRQAGPVHADGQSLMVQGPASRLTAGDPWNSSVQLFRHFKRFGDLADLHQAIRSMQDLIKSTSIWDGWYCKGLGNLGGALCYRFSHLGELNDLEDAISMFRDAVDLTPDGHPDKAAHLGNLGNSLVSRFERLGELGDLEEAILRHKCAIDLTPCGHPHKPSHFGFLGSCFKVRFERLGELSDLENAISMLKSAIDLIPEGHPDKPGHLGNLGISFMTRFEHLAELTDLEDAISTLRNAVDLTPDDHPDKPGRLTNLGNSFGARFQRFGELSDLEDSILRHKDAVELTPDGHSHKPGRLNNLGNSFSARFRRLGELNDLEEAISTLRSAVDLTSDGHPDKPCCLSNLGDSFHTRHECLGELCDLEDAISRHREAVDLTPDDHPDKPSRLYNLSESLITRFERFGELSDLDDATLMLRDAVGLTPRRHPHKPIFLSTLGSASKIRFERLGELSDLEDAISLLRDAVDLSPHDHSCKPGCLNNLGNSLRARFERLGRQIDLEDAISTLMEAVELTPHGHSQKPVCLNNLGYTFNTRFEHFGELSDLEAAISVLSNAVDLIPDGHRLKPRCLSNLGHSFRARFERVGELSDLEEAISRYRGAVALIPHGHPDEHGCLSNLGNAIMIRFRRLGELTDLADAILMLGNACELTPNSHPEKAHRLNNLGSSLLTLFQRRGEPRDLEFAISMHRDAVKLTPDDHPDKVGRLNNLGISLRTRFGHIGEVSDLEDAISTLKNVINFTPDGHPDKPGRLYNLGDTLITRFEHFGELSDIENAISMLRDAVNLSPHSHHDKPVYLSNLGHSFNIRFERLNELSDLEHAISLYSHAASNPIGSIEVRFDASLKWISCAQRMSHHTLLHAYSVAISLLPQLAWIGLPLMNRCSRLTQATDVAREAAAAALDSGLPETAVEWLEQGRSVFWGELFQYRGFYEELSSAHPNHASRLRGLSAALGHYGAAREQLLSTLWEQIGDAPPCTPESLQREADKHRALAIERDKLLQEIRSFPGFEQFLLQKEFSLLQSAAHSGPVVILNAAQHRCDALIIHANVDHVIHVPLPNFTFKRSAGLQNMLERLLGHARAIRGDDREGSVALRPGASWESLLSTLWDGVVKPVLDALAFSQLPCDLPRIFWCPTGPFVFLPIHAAGFYDNQYLQPGYKVSDLVVSSYVPTLSSLTLLPNSTAASTGDFRLLVVRQPSSDGLPRLPGVATELEHIKKVIRNPSSAHITVLESSVGTVEEVLELMEEADWVHFACHGVQDTEIPTDSGLCLANRRRLKLGDIIALSRPRRGLAFLSACQTATGDERLSDEAIHIAAGMLFAGYQGVIGTMWSISDKLAPDVARDVYEQLFRNGTPDCRDAARALHGAIGRLQESGKVSFVTWLPFIHVGL